MRSDRACHRVLTPAQLLRRYFCNRALAIMEQEYAAGRSIDLEHIARLTIATRPPFYGVSYDTALVMVSHLRREGAEGCSNRGMRRLLWLDLLAKVNRLIDGPRAMRLGRAVQTVLTDCRPDRWYISERTALKWLSTNY